MKTRYLFAGLALAALAMLCLVPSASDVLHAASLGGGIPVVAAMGMMPAGAFRGIALARADASDPNKILAELQRTFEAFKVENDARLSKKADVVIDEKVDRINAAVSDMQAALTEANIKIATMAVNGNGSGKDDPVKAEHRDAFSRFFRRGVDAGLRDLEVKAKLTTQSDPDGGYLVPEEMSTTIDRVLGVVSVMRQIANVMPVGAPVYKKIVNMGGAGYGWVGEEQARPETGTPTLKELAFTVMEMYANPATTQTMLDDGITDIAAWLADEVQITFAEQEGAAYIAGNGVNKPRGVLSYPTVANASYAWGSLGFTVTGGAAAFASSNPADAMVDLYYSLKQGYRSGASWLMSDAVMSTVRKFKDGQGNYLWAPPSAAGEVATILSKPVYNDDNMPALGANAFPVAFGDFRRGYMILDRTGIRVLRDPFTNKPYVHFYTTKRVGGGVSNFEAIKLLKCST